MIRLELITVIMNFAEVMINDEKISDITSLKNYLAIPQKNPWREHC